ncbi:MAG: hypothetical protein GC145_03295 [Caulobacter sp.]|nr:hypothetical protein [Caulobacter sp.]
MKPGTGAIVALLSGLAACAHVDTGPPTAADVTAFETSRILTPLSSPTRTPDRGVVEFAPTVEVRNAACTPTDRRGVFRCAYDSQVREWPGQQTGDWSSRQVLLRLNARGDWVSAE